MMKSQLLGALIAAAGMAGPFSVPSWGGHSFPAVGANGHRGKVRNKAPRRFSGVLAARRAARKARRSA